MSKKVLILESYPSLALGLLELLAANGLTGKAVVSPVEAISVLEQEHFDFVLSGVLRWEDCYLFALEKYGAGRVIVYTASSVLANQIKRTHRHIKVYRKAVIDDVDFNERTPESVIKEIAAFLTLQHQKEGDSHE